MADRSSLEDLKASMEGTAAASPVVVQGMSSIQREPKVDAQGRAYATGKRKNAVARVWIKSGSGKIVSTAVR